MRLLLSLGVIGLAAVLAGCHHDADTTTVIPPPTTDSIGGIVAGLSGTVVLQNNGGDNLSLSNDGAFVFPVTVQPDTAYAVTVVTQPLNQVCTVSNGTGTSGVAGTAVTNITVACGLSSAATDLWTWVGGSDYVNAPGVYGTLGAAAAANTPGARKQAVSWTDAAGNFWLFGGNSVGNVGMLNDLWEYSPVAQQWIWQGGSQTVGAAAVYGTQGTPAATNNPGAREGAAKWTDTAGNLWLFGGDVLAGTTWEEFNDLWEYNVSSAQWTWVGGSNIVDNAGSYGALGVAAAGNFPPARSGAITWVDSTGIFWLFGGSQLNASGSYLAVFNDLWSYSPTTGLWTWVGGSNTPNAAGVYGTQHAGAAGNGPGARVSGVSWTDTAGNFWLFGGYGYAQGGGLGNLNDLWEYNLGSGVWTWISGSSGTGAAGAYGTQGIADSGNAPGARAQAVGWLDSSGNFWLFGGFGVDATDVQDDLNDLWRFTQTP